MIVINRQEARKPPWLKVPLATAGVAAKFRSLVAGPSHTICESARCPNLGDCWKRGTASFLILGNRCTRNCAYCNVEHGVPAKPDNREPERIASIVSKLGMQYVVITSVTRDDLPDGGANAFRQVISILKKETGVRVEVLTPDFQDKGDAITTVLAGRPDTFAHNLETVERLFPQMRRPGSYHKSLRFLRTIKEYRPDQITKSGIMIGLGETTPEIQLTLRELHQAKVDILTIGQYLQPRRDLAEVKKIYTPEAFAELRKYAEQIGFRKVYSGPLVRSSYRAEEALLLPKQRSKADGHEPRVLQSGKPGPLNAPGNSLLPLG